MITSTGAVTITVWLLVCPVGHPSLWRDGTAVSFHGCQVKCPTCLRVMRVM